MARDGDQWLSQFIAILTTIIEMMKMKVAATVGSIHKESYNFYEHIVLLKLKPDVPIEEQEEAVTQVQAFKNKIPGIVDLIVGVNVTEEVEHTQGYTLGIRVTFTNLQA
ncbi:Dabb family protein [Paenibacillus hexagrammi]|uniref:Dabb family protein n=1 Tax=Paenibacillus hexagrammi TaxID=2908839 RepID=A0ABY3SG56_9BACL|nr:Dabb family protein [Paenibacillus sp. YPD9-1]UJF33018.1 Dabb family protein [Paenibacillus sp. YPD9-1]